MSIMVPRKPKSHNTAITILFLLSLQLISTTARKALGGSGGLLTSGSSSQGGGESFNSNDPFKLVEVSEGSGGWTIPPIDSEELIQKLGKEHRNVAQYISNTLGKAPLTVQLNKKKVGVKNSLPSSPTAIIGGNSQDKYRAQVIPSSNTKGKKSNLRSVWYLASHSAVSKTSAIRQSTEGLLTKTYEENTSLFHPSHLVIEVFLPKTRACKGGNPLITYSIPVGAGTTSPKSRVSQANGKITVFPNGRKRKQGGGDSNSSNAIEVGKTSLHLNTGPSLVDPSWAKGRKYFWKGRSLGQV
mmetsp:Transcript_2100/g.2513  ORF Transcript_2100/g.2513 Transcript_2100/m.2513 type:complete len:299 (+) Transcript_2100:88-984(+)